MTTDRPTEPCPEPRADRESPPEPSSWASSAALTPPPDRPAEPCPVCKGQFVACVRCDGAGIVLSPPTTEPTQKYLPGKPCDCPPADERATVPDRSAWSKSMLMAQLAAAESEVARQRAELSARQHEVSLMRDSLRAVDHELELLDRYGRELDEIGKSLGCDHKDDGYMRCVRDRLDEADRLRARAEAGEAIIRRYKDCHDSDNDHDPCGCKVCDLAAAHLASQEPKT